MAARMHPSDLRAMMAAILANACMIREGDYDPKIMASMSDALLAALGIQEEAPTPKVDYLKSTDEKCACGRPWVWTSEGGLCPVCLQARATSAEAQVSSLTEQRDAHRAVQIDQGGEWAPRGPVSMGYPLVEGVPTFRLTDAGHNGQDLEAEGGNDVWMQRMGKGAAGRFLDGQLHDGYPEPRP